MVFYLGEFTTINDAIEQQLDNPAIVFSAEGVFSSYKWEMIQQRTPELLIIGSSRTMSFRSQFFHLREDAVFNGGMSLGNVWRVLWILEELKQLDKLPEVIILGADQDWFVPDRSSLEQDDQIEIPAIDVPPPSLENIFNRSRHILSHMLDNQLLLSDVLDRRDPFYETFTIGFNGIVRSTGFRSDGSMIVNPTNLNTLSDDNRFTNARVRMANNDGRLTQSDTVNMTSVDAMEQVIQFCLDNDIELIVFSPPYAPTFYEEMQANGGYTYIPKLVELLAQRLDDAGYTYFDFSDGVIQNVDDSHYLDGTHGSEFVYLNMYLEMLQADESVLGIYSDVAYLSDFAVSPHPRSRFEVFGVNQ